LTMDNEGIHFVDVFINRRTDPVGADDPGGPLDGTSKRAAGVVGPYRVGAVLFQNHPEGIPSLSIVHCTLSIQKNLSVSIEKDFLPIDFSALTLYIHSIMPKSRLGIIIPLKWGRIHGKRVDSFDESFHGI